MRVPRRPLQDRVHFVAMHQRRSSASPRREAFGQHRRRPHRNPRARASDTARRAARTQRDRPRRTRATILRRQSAARARRAGRRARRCDRARRGEPSGEARRIRSGRRANRAAGVPSACRLIVWPERPTRCSSVAIRCGDPTWQTRSTWPMSMPSSSDAVATSAFSAPVFSRCSASSRISFDRLP